MTSAPIRTAACLFCGADAPGCLSNEHINPQWLLQHLGLPRDDQLFQGVASSETGHLVRPPRVHSTFRFVLGRVCEACNTGWMSRLEGEAVSILIPLIDRGRDLESLSDAERAVLCRWAAKTAYLHTYAGPLKDPVDEGHLRQLAGDAGHLPEGVGVFGMQSEYVKPSAHIQTGTWPHLAAKQPVEILASAYKIGLQFRHLYLLVAYWPNHASALALLRSMHVPISASREEFAEYTADVTIGDGPIDRLAAFANTLAVFHVEQAV